MTVWVLLAFKLVKCTDMQKKKKRDFFSSSFGRRRKWKPLLKWAEQNVIADRVRTWALDECWCFVTMKPVSGATCQSSNSAARASDRSDRQQPDAAQTEGTELYDDSYHHTPPPDHHHHFSNRTMVEWLKTFNQIEKSGPDIGRLWTRPK